MNEIEKMYKLANIQPYYKKRIECKEGYSIGQPCGKSPCIDCDKSVFEDVMPPFTAEKQIELIKLLSYYYNITISKNFENDYTFQCEGDDVRRYVFTSGQDFAEQLASFVNICYDLLPEEERKQIKEILE